MDILNGRYNPKGVLRAQDFHFGTIYNPVSIIFSQSVFTHMYEEDILTYVREFKRVMSNDSVVSATIFLLKDPAKMPYKLEHKLNDHCRYFDEKDPLHVIGYDEAWLRDALGEIGFEVKIVYGYQDRLELRLRR
jgi:hypothetical protein